MRANLLPLAMANDQDFRKREQGWVEKKENLETNNVFMGKSRDLSGPTDDWQKP